jgi:hypothetical protein
VHEDGVIANYFTVFNINFARQLRSSAAALASDYYWKLIAVAVVAARRLYPLNRELPLVLQSCYSSPHVSLLPTHYFVPLSPIVTENLFQAIFC